MFKIISLALLVYLATRTKNRFGSRGSNSQYVPPPTSISYNVNCPPQMTIFNTNQTPKSSTYYHGGPMQGVLDIYHNYRIKIGNSSPAGFWMTPNFITAVSFARGGGIVQLSVDSDVVLYNTGGDYFVLQIPNGSQGQYWTFDSGVYMVAVYDCHKNKIR